jgi:CubicO group peptidase (beta-lactamase class C family)
VFQIGSTTKAFLAAKLAIAVDRKRLKWDDRVVDLDPTFSLKDPYVTREFRIYDLLAQRSGLPPYANDPLWIHLYFDAEWLMHSLRFVEPITSFRSTFAYTNITHLIAGRIVVKALDAPDWPTLARREILAPLGMSDASFTAEAIDKAPDHAVGHRWTATGSVPIPFDPSFPYLAGPAGDINASVEDCARWLRLQGGNGVFSGRRLISADNLAATRTPKAPPDFKPLAGDYASAVLGPASISLTGDDLTLTVKHTGARLRLEPFDGAVFTVRLISEGRFAPVVAMQGDTPIGFASFEAMARDG